MGTIFQVNESNGNVTITGAVDVGNHQIHNVADPTSAQDVSTKNYVDTIAQGITWKQSVQAATTTTLPANVYNNGSSGVGATLTGISNGALTIDGYTVATNDRVLIKNEATGANNGIYSVTATGSGISVYVLTRTTDYDTPADVIAGTATFVEQGTVNSDSGFVQTTTGTITIGTTSLVFTQFTGLGEVTAGTGLTKSGNTISLITPVSVANGGTGDSTLTNHSVLLGQGTGAIAFAGPGTTNFALVSNGVSSDPSFQAIVNSITGTSNQVIASSSTGAVTLSLPQSIATSSSPSFASETLSNTTNQLVLGTTNTTTISSTAPSASRTYTIPDAGTTANFVLDQGNYTIGGTWTFSNPVTITPTTNQLVLGTTRTVTLSATQPATASRTYTIPDQGANANIVGDKANYTIGGTWTFNNNISLASSKAVVFTDNTTNTVTMEATNSTTSWTFKLPTTSGSSNFFLQTDGSGNTTWASGGSGTVGNGTSGQIAVYNGTNSITSGVTASMNNTKLTSLANGTASTDAAAFGQVTPLFAYRRPNLTYSSSTVVSVETGLDGTSGDAVILFPDGNLRTETSSSRYQMTISQNAVFNNATLGNNQGGLRTGSVANNTWYALYAVKVTTFAANWVLVADTVLPLQSNYSTLNTNFGTNSWVYLGMIRYGDRSTHTNVILKFVQCGNRSFFYNNCVGQAQSMPGIDMADTAGGTSVTYTTTNGTGASDVPNHLTLVDWGVDATSTGTNFAVTYQSDTGIVLFRLTNSPGTTSVIIPNQGAINGLVSSTTNSTGQDIFLCGFVDSALGVGSNPLL